MQKEEVLRQIRNLASKRIVSIDEVTAAYDEGVKAQIDTDITVTRQSTISDIMYYVGGAIVFIGISVLIWQHWSALNNTTKIIATLGSGVASYITAVFLSRNERLKAASIAFYFISALVSPLGLYVTFDIAGFHVSSYGTQSLISGILLVTYLLSYAVYRKTVFIVFNIIFGTWLFFSFTSYLVGSNPYFTWKFSAYRVLCAGLTYLLLGYHFSQLSKRALTGALYGFGIFYFLGAALVLGGWNPNQNMLWELVFPGFVFGVMFLSIQLRSRSFLTFGSIYLIVYLLKITAEYFSKSLGWSLALVLVGLALIAIGYLHFNLRKKYFS